MALQWYIYMTLQRSASHDHSEIILICGFAAQETFIIITNVGKSIIIVGNVVLLNIYVIFLKQTWCIEGLKNPAIHFL